jgi:4'-phosphopantetheinyl transferase
VSPTALPGLSEAGTESEIQLWTASLDDAAAAAAFVVGRTLLSEEELERAGRFRFDADRASFVASRVWLRVLLAERLGVAPTAIRLLTAAGGKPELAPPLPTWLRFSMSRSGSRGLYALARGAEVGVDLEDCSRIVDVEAVGSMFFSLGERGVLSGLEGDTKQRGFYRIWTRKEAVLKAMGVGLDAPISLLDVTADVARWDTAVPSGSNTARSWCLRDVDVAPGYAAALAFDETASQDLPAVRDVAELNDSRSGALRMGFEP